MSIKFGSHLSRSEIRGITAFCVILAMLSLGFWILMRYDKTAEARPSSDTVAEIRPFWDSVRKYDHQAGLMRRHLARPFQFNPNTADSATFVQLGLPYWIAGRIIHYRKAGGIFRKASDFKRIYGLAPRDYMRLLPYIELPAHGSTTTSDTTRNNNYIRRPIYTTVKKEPRAGQTELNRADSLSLLALPGIGPYYTHRILRYGQLLGGYVGVSQLMEIKGMTAELSKWFYVSNPKIRKKNINKLSFRDLLRHPYLNYEQVKAIFQHRQKYGPLHSLQELSNNDAFTPEDLKRLTPYVSFE